MNGSLSNFFKPLSMNLFIGASRNNKTKRACIGGILSSYSESLNKVVSYTIEPVYIYNTLNQDQVTLKSIRYCLSDLLKFNIIYDGLNIFTTSINVYYNLRGVLLDIESWRRSNQAIVKKYNSKKVDVCDIANKILLLNRISRIYYISANPEDMVRVCCEFLSINNEPMYGLDYTRIGSYIKYIQTFTSLNNKGNIEGIHHSDL